MCTLGAVVLTLKAIGRLFGLEIVRERLTRTVSGPKDHKLASYYRTQVNEHRTVEAQGAIGSEVDRHGGRLEER
jgi:hypothetical protein